MSKRVFGVAAVCAAFLFVGAQGAGAGNGDVTCTDAFSGTARNVIVPHDSDGCDLSGATVTHDVIVEHDTGIFAEGLSVGHDIRLDHDTGVELGGATVGNDLISGGSDIHLERTTIGGSLIAVKPFTVQTGGNGPDSPGGPVRIGRDLIINGTPDGNFIFDGMCSLTVGHDVRIVDRSVTLGIGFGDNCVFFGQLPNAVGHDLVVTHSSALVGFFGPSSIEVGSVTVGHDLVFTHNTAAPGGYLEVADNHVAGNAICEANSPAAGKDASDGPNVVAGKNTCG